MKQITEADEARDRVLKILINNTFQNQLKEIENQLHIVLKGNYSDEFKTRLIKDVRKVRNFSDHLNKMKLRY